MANPNDERGWLSLSLNKHVGSLYQTRTYPKFIVTTSIGLGWQFIETNANKFAEVVSFVVAWGHTIRVGVSPFTSDKAPKERYLLPLALTCERAEEDVLCRYQTYLYRMDGRWMVDSASDISGYIYMMYYILKWESAPPCVRGSHRCHNPWWQELWHL